MAKGVASVDSVDFIKGWIKGCQSGMTKKEIAESMGMEYNACVARHKSLCGHVVDLDKFQPVAGKRGRQLKSEDLSALNALVAEALGK